MEFAKKASRFSVFFLLKIQKKSLRLAVQLNLFKQNGYRPHGFCPCSVNAACDRAGAGGANCPLFAGAIGLGFPGGQ